MTKLRKIVSIVGLVFLIAFLFVVRSNHFKDPKVTGGLMIILGGYVVYESLKYLKNRTKD